jgi:hypothetical protein
LKSKPIFRILACLITAGFALLAVQTVLAGRVFSVLAPWLFRHVPFMVYWGHADPEGGVAAWGGPGYETLYVYTENNCISSEECIYPDGLYKTGDYGLSWDHITTTVPGVGPMDYKLSLLVTHPISPNLMFSVATLGWHNGLYRSVDYGVTWTLVHTDIIYDIEVDPNHPNVIYLSYCCQPNEGIYRSDDYGVTWTRIATDMFNDLEMVGDDSGVMFAARYFSTNTYEGVYRSPDRGLTWVQLDFSSFQDHIMLDPQQPGRVYTYGGSGVYRSDNSGKDWSSITNNLPATIDGTVIQSLFYDPSIGRLWCGVKLAGMWYSDDLGGFWRQWNYGVAAYGGGIYGPQCVEADISPNGNYYAVCSGLIHFNLNPWPAFLPAVSK